MGTLSRVKQAWREADAANTRALKRVSENLPLEDIDEPLDPEVQKNIIEGFLKFHNWNSLDSRTMGSDALLGRLRREFERKQPSMFSIMRAKTLAKAMRGAPPKRTRVADRVIFEYQEDEGDTPTNGPPTATHPVREFFEHCETYFLTAAVAGFFDITLSDGTTAKYASWYDTWSYQRDLELKSWPLVGRFTNKSIAFYVADVEEFFRAKALEKARVSTPPPFGKCLLAAAKEFTEVWQEKKDLLLPLRGTAPPDRHLGGGGGGGGGNGGGGGGNKGGNGGGNYGANGGGNKGGGWKRQRGKERQRGS